MHSVTTLRSVPLPRGSSELGQRLNHSVYLLRKVTYRNSFSMSKMTATTCPVGGYQQIHLTIQDGY